DQEKASNQSGGSSSSAGGMNSKGTGGTSSGGGSSGGGASRAGGNGTVLTASDGGATLEEAMLKQAAYGDVGEATGEMARSTLAFAIPDAGATDTGSSVAASVDFLIPDSAGTIQIDGKNFLKADPTVDSVKFGMFDHAFDAKGTLLADFIKEDSHRFHIRVVDPEAKGKGRVTAKYSTVKWSTAVL